MRRFAGEANFRLRLPAPDLSFRLSEAERSSVQEHFDIDALEALLGMMQPSERTYVFASFQKQRGPTQRQLTYIRDPVLQEALGRVWRPYWESIPEQALMDDPAISSWAGVAEARARILAARSRREP
jgi:hypothetical protein